MFQRGQIPLQKGVWVDAYNQTIDTEKAGTVLTVINQNNYFTTELWL
jgi:hypothetical protein